MNTERVAEYFGPDLACLAPSAAHRMHRDRLRAIDRRLAFTVCSQGLVAVLGALLGIAAWTLAPSAGDAGGSILRAAAVLNVVTILLCLRDARRRWRELQHERALTQLMLADAEAFLAAQAAAADGGST